MTKKLGTFLLISGLLFSLNSYGYHGKRDGLQGHSKQDIDRYKYIEKERANSKAAIIRRLEAKLLFSMQIKVETFTAGLDPAISLFSIPSRF